MGEIFGQAMTRKDEDLRRKNMRELPSSHTALPQQGVPRSLALEYNNQQFFNIQEKNATTPITPPVQNKENSTNALIPFEPNFDEDDEQEVPSFDIAQLLDDMLKENPTKTDTAPTS